MQAQTQPQLTAAIDVATSELQSGITTVLRTWDALRTSVESEWGGFDSTTKAENLRASIFEYFDYRKQSKAEITREDLEDKLDIFMEDEFGIVLEDESEKHVAEVIFQLYEKCGNGDFTLSRKLVADAQINAAKKVKPQVQTVGENEDSDNDDAMSVDGTADKDSNYVEQAGGFLFGPPPGHRAQPTNVLPSRQLGEAAPEKMKVEVDEDGFMSVPTKKKGKR